MDIIKVEKNSLKRGIMSASPSHNAHFLVLSIPQRGWLNKLVIFRFAFFNCPLPLPVSVPYCRKKQEDLCAIWFHSFELLTTKTEVRR